MSNRSRKIAVIGGGWAGLSAAVKLTSHGYHVTLFESAKQLGGRARCVAFNEQRVDNGQHLLLGAYSQTLNILRLCHVDVDRVFLRTALNIKVIKRHGGIFHLLPNHLPAPLNILFAILNLSNLSINERLRTIWFLVKLRLTRFEISRDITVKKLLRRQPHTMIEMFWEPLCIAALNTGINEASAKIFLNVIKDSFTQGVDASDLLLPKIDLADLFVHPAMQYIEEHGGTLLLGKKIDLILTNNEISTIIDADGNPYTVDAIVLACSPQSTLALLEKSSLLETTQQQLSALCYEPICTIYLQYSHDIHLSQPMIGLTNCTGQWIFDRQFCGQAGLMAVVISADGPHMQIDKMTLAQLVSDELSELFGWPDANSTFVIREKRATFKAHVNIDKLRPSTNTAEKNLWLCGDYTSGSYPATLEAAVQSGLQCSQEIIHSMK